MSRRGSIAMVVLAALLLALCCAGYGIYRRVTTTVADAYAVWNVAALCNDYMDAHDGAWPHGWDDLGATYNAAHEPNPEHMADLQSRVEVDWTANPRLLASAPEPTDKKPSFQVIWLKDGKHTHWTGAEPNWLIWDHFHQENQKRSEATTSPATRSSDGSSRTGA